MAVLIPDVDEFGAPAWRCDFSLIDSTTAFSGIRRVEVQPEDVPEAAAVRLSSGDGQKSITLIHDRNFGVK